MVRQAAREDFVESILNRQVLVGSLLLSLVSQYR